MQFVMQLKLAAIFAETANIIPVQGILKDVTMETEIILMDVQKIVLLKTIQLVLTQLELKVFVDDVEKQPCNLQKSVTMETMMMGTVAKETVQLLSPIGDAILLCTLMYVMNVETASESILKSVTMGTLGMETVVLQLVLLKLILIVMLQ